ncbi:MAG TPA: N-acetylmuramoyl-L-alanine amidase [Vicinamibacteria bacterium]|nr:N-acetylmuramoyl-L-alanine amidase [Vicinamibacteria bacterium]
MRSVLAVALLLLPGMGAGGVALPARIERIVLHTPGGPFYGRPEMRFVFLSPSGTLALWRKPSFGAHWIVWTDGSLWPRHPRPGESPGRQPPSDGPADEEWRRRLAEEAAPAYAHVQGANHDTVGIEVSHSGRSQDPFPRPQVLTLVWLLRALLDMSEGRLTEAAIVGHKDLDRQPAYVSDSCEATGCPVYVDEKGRPFRRRVDPPEHLFDALAAAGLKIPRPASGGDQHLLRAEAIPPGARPRIAP